MAETVAQLVLALRKADELARRGSLAGGIGPTFYLEAAGELERLSAVAKAAKALVDSVGLGLMDTIALDERKLTALESALEAAGYGMTEKEFHERLQD